MQILVEIGGGKKRVGRQSVCLNSWSYLTLFSTDHFISFRTYDIATTGIGFERIKSLVFPDPDCSGGGNRVKCLFTHDDS